MFAAMWRVLTRPAPGVFEDARAGASLDRAVIATIVIGAATGLIGGLINVLSVGDSVGEALTLMIITPFRLLFALIVVNAFWFVVARGLRGQGNFSTQVYLGALVFIPLNALASLATIIPTLGAWLAVGLLVYGAVVNIFALRAAHGGSAWQISNSVLFALSLIGGIIGWAAISSIPS